MNLAKKISFNNLSNLHTYFFYLFLFSIPFQARKVFLTEYSFYSGAFTEYATFFIYASDILLILTLIFWLVFNKKLYKEFNFENLKSTRKLPTVFLLLLAFIIWLIISTIVSNNYAEISVFYILKYIELSLLIIYIYFNLKDKNRLIRALFTISLAGFFQGLIAIYQFIYQCPLFKSPLLHKLTGESTVYPQLPGIAKIIVNNEKLIRSYGTFPHPNILGGFLIVSILISIYLLLKHKDYILSSIGTKFNLFYNINNTKGQGCVSSIFWIILIFTQITALLFTFSRTAWFSFLLSLFIISVFYFYNRKIVSRETIRSDKIAKRKLFFFLSSQNFFWNDSGRKNIWDPVRITFTKIARKILFIDTFWISPEFISGGMTKDIKTTKIREALSKLKNRLKSNKNVSRETIITKSGIDYYYLFCRFKELFIVILFTLILIAVYSSHINSRINEELSINNSSFSNYLPSNYAFNDRSFYNNVSRETISGNFIFGSGPGTFIFQINSYLTKNNIHQKLESWQYQPAHNIYLLIASEIGIIGLFIFLLFLSQTISNSFKTIKKPLNKRLFSNDVQIVSRETIFSLELNYYLLAILISFLFIGLFDHYFWTLQQGRLMLWLILGLILINDSIMLKKDK